MQRVPDDSRLCSLGERPKSGAEQQPSGHAQVWFPTDRNMAGCDNCSFWVHDHCDEAAGTAIEFGDAVTYYCPPCRHQADAHHKLQVTPACLLRQYWRVALSSTEGSSAAWPPSACRRQDDALHKPQMQAT